MGNHMRPESAPDSPGDKEYAERLGSHLRSIRKQRGLSLNDIERRTNGKYRASVLGAYERGERSISVPRLAKLAEVYGVALEELLPPEEGWRPVAENTSSPRDSLTIDLEALESSLDPEAQIIERYVNRIQIERGTLDEGRLTIRREDIRMMGAFLDMAEDEFVRHLQNLGVLAQPDDADSPT